MIQDIDNHNLQLNFLEFLTFYLEDRATLQDVLKANERIYTRDHKTLSKQLISATTSIHKLKRRIDNKEKVNAETITNTITDAILELTKY